MTTIWEREPLNEHPKHDKAGLDEWQASSCTRRAQALALAGETFTIHELAEPIGELERTEHYGALAARMVNAGLIVPSGRFTQRSDPTGRARDVRLYRGTDKLKQLEFTPSPPRASAPPQSPHE